MSIEDISALALPPPFPSLSPYLPLLLSLPSPFLFPFSHDSHGGAGDRELSEEEQGKTGKGEGEGEEEEEGEEEVRREGWQGAKSLLLPPPPLWTPLNGPLRRGRGLMIPPHCPLLCYVEKEAGKGTLHYKGAD